MAGITLGNLGTNSLVGTPSSTTLALKGLVAGPGIGISASSTDITIQPSISNVCIAVNSTTTVMNNSTSASITLNTNSLDPNGMHSTVTNTERINILTTGIYFISFYVLTDINTSATNVVSFNLVNQSGSSLVAFAQNPNLNSTYAYYSASTIASFSAGNYIKLNYNNVCGQTITIQGGYPYLKAIQLSN